MIIENDFNIEQIVYLKHDFEQKPRMIITICINKYGVLYELISGTEGSIHSGYELSSEKTVY